MAWVTPKHDFGEAAASTSKAWKKAKIRAKMDAVVELREFVVVAAFYVQRRRRIGIFCPGLSVAGTYSTAS